jgi:hypothetical protein
METTCTWAVPGDGQTGMTLRKPGRADGLFPVAAPVMTAAMRRADQADLIRLTHLMESAP